jgi:hypothetical protein
LRVIHERAKRRLVFEREIAISLQHEGVHVLPGSGLQT